MIDGTAGIRAAKAVLRASCKATLAAIGPARRAKGSRLAARIVEKTEAYRRAGLVLAFLSMPSEIDTAPVIEAARHGAAAKLALRGRGGIRAAQNIIGRRVRSGRPWLVVSTPRSGWTDCAGERGPGIAMWLALADWMPRAFPQHSLLFLCNSHLNW